MDKRKTFDEDVVNYDQFRPRYCERLFAKIIEFGQIDKEKKTVEIGCGTGQATKPFLETGCTVTAIELGENLADFTKDKFSNYQNFTIQNLAFEDFRYEKDSIDLVYSATAFHWIPDEIGYPKVYDMLKSGGTVALFWNQPAAEEGKLDEELQEIYVRIRKDKIREPKEVMRKYQETEGHLKKYGFVSYEHHCYTQTRTLNSEDYICLLNTYSDHISLENDLKTELYSSIQMAIEKHGGIIRLIDTIDLYLAKKP